MSNKKHSAFIEELNELMEKHGVMLQAESHSDDVNVVDSAQPVKYDSSGKCYHCYLGFECTYLSEV